MPLSQIPVRATRHNRRFRRPIEPVPLAKAVSGILFDMCNILYDDTVWRRWVLMLLSRLGLSTNYCSFFRLWDREYLDEVHRGQREFRQAFASFLRCAGLSTGRSTRSRRPVTPGAGSWKPMPPLARRAKYPVAPAPARLCHGRDLQFRASCRRHCGGDCIDSASKNCFPPWSHPST